MKLDRNIPQNEGRGKYALLKLRELERFDDGSTFGGINVEIEAALKLLESSGILDWGRPHTESEFFVIRLKDKFSLPALRAYANSAEKHDAEYAAEIYEMANRSGPHSKFCKVPD